MTTQRSFQEGYDRTENGQWEVIANHEISGVTPEMIDWWWDHIDTTERYKLWHPTDHVSFEWLIAPATNGHIGAIHRIQEFLNGTPEVPATIEIRWEDTMEANAEYDHVLLATFWGDAQGSLMHEYQATPSGTRMRSHIHLAQEAPEEIAEAVYEHLKQEMQNFTVFLPELYQSIAGRERKQ